jgi:broad specificity phosphatase PhoE
MLGGVGVEIVFEAHPLTMHSEAGIASGWLPASLSENGRRHAREMRRRHRREHFAAVYHSDLLRVIETVEIAFIAFPGPVVADRRLRDINYGALNGAPEAQLWHERATHIDTRFPRGESLRQVVDRTRDLLVDLAARWDGQRLAVVAHPVNRWALDHLLRGEPLEKLVEAPFEGDQRWAYDLPDGWTGRSAPGP